MKTLGETMFLLATHQASAANDFPELTPTPLTADVWCGPLEPAARAEALMDLLNAIDTSAKAEIRNVRSEHDAVYVMWEHFKDDGTSFGVSAGFSGYA